MESLTMWLPQRPQVGWQASSEEVLKLEPGFSTEAYVAKLHYKRDADR